MAERRPRPCDFAGLWRGGLSRGGGHANALSFMERSISAACREQMIWVSKIAEAAIPAFASHSG